jgi:hypothetical protein
MSSTKRMMVNFLEKLFHEVNGQRGIPIAIAEACRLSALSDGSRPLKAGSCCKPIILLITPTTPGSLSLLTTFG